MISNLPHDESFWETGDLRPNAIMINSSRRLDWSDLRATCDIFVVDNSARRLTFHAPTVIGIYSELKTIQRTERGHNGAVTVHVCDSNLLRSGGSLFLAAVNVHLDRKDNPSK